MHVNVSKLMTNDFDALPQDVVDGMVAEEDRLYRE